MDGNRADARARDRAAIQKLREQDGAATLAGDVAAIAELWTDDIVLIEPGQRCAMKESHVYVRITSSCNFCSHWFHRRTRLDHRRSPRA
jgi:hypothetical protein